MTHLIKGQTRADAWLQGMDLILNHGRQLNLILDIPEPMARDSRHAEIVSCLDAMCESRPKPQATVHGVAETIFPFGDYVRHGFDQMASRYLINFQTLKAAMRWGTYAHRMLERPLPDGTTVNPLKVLIDKMTRYHSSTGPTHGQSYEIGVTDNAFEVPLYRIAIDRNRPYSGPCLSHLSFKLHSNAVHLAATYRSSDYGFKTYGNLLGLTRLLYAVASEVGADVGSLCVHTTLAMTDAPITTLRELLAKIEESTNGDGD